MSPPNVAVPLQCVRKRASLASYTDYIGATWYFVRSSSGKPAEAFQVHLPYHPIQQTPRFHKLRIIYYKMDALRRFEITSVEPPFPHSHLLSDNSAMDVVLQIS